MKKRDIAKFKRQVAKGNPELRLIDIRTALERVRKDLQQLQTKKSVLHFQCQQERHVWGIESLPPDAPPSPLDTQARQASLCFFGGASAAVIEVLVAGALARRYEISPLIPMTLAALLPLVLKTALAAFLHDEERPHETLRKLRNYILGPSLLLFALAVLLLLLARVLDAEWALVLLPVLNLAPLALGIGCLGTAAALFALWHLLSWSRASARAYNRLETEEMQTSALRFYLETQEEKLRHDGQKTQPLPIQQKPSGDHGAQLPTLGLPSPPPQVINGQAANSSSNYVQRLIPALFLLLPLSQNGCQLQSSSEPLHSGLALSPTAVPSPIPVVAPTNEPVVSSEINGLIDRSSSLSEDSLRLALNNFLHALPELSETYNVRRLTLCGFAQKGWECPPLFAKLLPAKPQPAPPQPMPGNDLDTFGIGVAGQAVAERERKRATQQTQQDLYRYRADLQTQLAELSTDKLLAPNAAYKERCTDLNGALAHATTPRNPAQRQLVFLFTDGADTCTRKLEAVPHPAREITLLVILATSQTGQLGHQEFRKRAAQLQKACPWAIVLPHFTDNYQQVLQQAFAREANRTALPAQHPTARAP